MTQPWQKVIRSRKGAKVVDAARAIFALLLAFSMGLQAQLSTSHFHLAAGDSGLTVQHGASGGSKHPEQKPENQCLLCQQLVSGHNYLFTQTHEPLSAVRLADAAHAPLVQSFHSLSQSFSWLSRAPPRRG